MKHLWIFVILCAAAAFGQNAYGPDFLNLHCTAPDPNSNVLFNIPPRAGLVPNASSNGNMVVYCDASSGTLKTSLNGGAYGNIGGSFQTSTASTAAGAIALGSGATNANSADSGAGAANLSMTLNINVGDFVILFTNTQDTSITVSDNGSGGGNTYVSVGGINFRAQSTAWVLQSATVSASQITVSDAANVYSISGATYKNVLSVAPIVTLSQNTNSLSITDVTTATNSLVVGCFNFNTATTFTPTSGSTVTSSFNGTNTVNTAMMSITTTSPGSYILSATTNQGSPNGQGIVIEITNATASNHSSPTLILNGTGWNGSTSISENTTLQAVVPNVSNPLAVITAMPALGAVNSGLFNNTRSDAYLSSIINGISPQVEFTGVSRPLSNLENAAVFGGMSIPASSTQTESHGIYGAVNSSSSTTFAVAGYFSARALGASTKIYGINPIVMDNKFAVTQLVGEEIDITQSNADAPTVKSVFNGLRVFTNGSNRPASGVYIAGAGGNNNFLAPLLIDDSLSGDPNPTRMIYLIPPDNLNTTVAIQLRNHTDAADVFEVSDAGAVTPSLYQSLTNCQLGGAAGTTSPAACSAAPAGMIAIPASQTSYTVNTTAVTANSEIFVQQMTDNSGLPSSPTCNSGATTPIQSARVAATSFTFTLTSVASVTCVKYWIIN